MRKIQAALENKPSTNDGSSISHAGKKKKLTKAKQQKKREKKNKQTKH